MLLKLLQTKHPEFDADTWADYWALYAGGQEWRKRAPRFIPPNPQEPADVYTQRLSAAHYRSYLGPIVDYFVAYLFSSKLVQRAMVDGKETEADDFYSRFKEDCDGGGTDLVEFLRNRLTRTMVHGKAFWLVELPRAEALPRTRAEWREQGLGDAKIRSLDRTEILDWSKDDRGRFEWLITYEASKPRRTPLEAREYTLHRWRVYDRQSVSVFEYLQPDGQPMEPDTDVGLVEQYDHGFDEVPIVALCLPEGLWVANRVESSQREHCQLSNANSWLIRRTCYAMPVFKLRDRTHPPKMGAGYYLMIGLEEGFEWTAPPASPFGAIQAEIAVQKDEIHRIVHQMAQGVENNAAAVGRSGLSKQVDADATIVMLKAIGAVIREAVERTYDMLSRARGEDLDWSVEGLDDYSAEDVEALLTAIAQSMALDIPSPTFAKEVRKRAALALVPGAPQDVRDTIVKEIDDNFVNESVLVPPQPRELEPEGVGSGEVEETEDEPRNTPRQ